MPIDYKKYCKDWKLRSRFVRFSRAKNHCEICGAENYKPHPITGSRVVLTTMHMDHDIQNNSLLNLKAGCQKCHLNYDKDIKKFSRDIGMPIQFCIENYRIYTRLATCIKSINKKLTDKNVKTTKTRTEYYRGFGYEHEKSVKKISRY